MPGAARLGDSCAGHGCFPATPIIAGSSDVIINGKPAARKGDAVLLHPCTCPNLPHGVHSRAISAGSSTVIINGKLAARIGDAIGCGGSVAAGSGNVIIGDTPLQSPTQACGQQAARSHAPLLALTPMLSRDVMEWGKTAGLPPPLDDVVQRRLRYKMRKEMVSVAMLKPELKQAAERLAFNNDNILRAEAAQYVYAVDEYKRGVLTSLPTAPVGLKILEIEELKDAVFTDIKSGFGAALFKSAINDETMLTYRGTNNAVTGKQDWLTNLNQGLGKETQQYNQAMDLARLAKNALPSPPVIVGHSLGGGLAASAVGVTGLQGYTFNAAGLHANTVARKDGAAMDRIAPLMTTQAVDGEILTLAQSWGKPVLFGLLSGAGAIMAGGAGAAVGAIAGGALSFSDALPKALGKMLPLTGSGWSPVARHGMDQVIAGIEGQKKDDIGVITSAFKGG